MITQEQAERLAHEWIDAFNRHDLDAVLSHYAEDVDFTSPFVVEVAGEPSGTLRGKDALRAYFQRALERYPDLGFELLEVLTGVNGYTILHRSKHRGRLATEVMLLNADGRVAKVMVHYGRTPPIE
jgi:ketosteroid isomerase-like protein